MCESKRLHLDLIERQLAMASRIQFVLERGPKRGEITVPKANEFIMCSLQEI